MKYSINYNKKIKHHQIAKLKFDNNIDLRKIAIFCQNLEFLSHQKVRLNKSPSPALTKQSYFFGDLKIQIFDVKCLFFLSRCYYQFSGFDDI